MIVILGMTCSGKDTLVYELVKNHNYKKIITCTTRPIREGEVPDRTYHFLNEEQFKQYIEEDKFFEYTSYNVVNNQTWYYGTLKSDIEKDYKNSVIIVNPDGFRTINKFYPDAYCVRLYAPLSVIRRRLLQRGDYDIEAERRIKADINDFMLIENANVDISFNTNDFSPSEIAEIINKEYRHV